MFVSWEANSPASSMFRTAVVSVTSKMRFPGSIGTFCGSVWIARGRLGSPSVRPERFTSRRSSRPARRCSSMRRIACRVTHMSISRTMPERSALGRKACGGRSSPSPLSIRTSSSYCSRAEQQEQGGRHRRALVPCIPEAQPQSVDTPLDRSGERHESSQSASVCGMRTFSRTRPAGVASRAAIVLRVSQFQLNPAYTPTADQPKAITSLAEGLGAEERFLTLLGATGTGKTFTMAGVIQAVQRPALVIAHNKTLAAQLCNEFREFFPENAVEYFVSYYDYYQPEAYVPAQDLYIEKDSSINDEIDRLRHAATASLFARKDVIIVASVSCIYGLGSPQLYREQM